jgi:hypothetical protein
MATRKPMSKTMQKLRLSDSKRNSRDRVIIFRRVKRQQKEFCAVSGD